MTTTSTSGKAGNVRSTTKRLIHSIATCQNCDWSADGYSRAAAAARFHAKQTGHTISVEQGYSYRLSTPTGDAKP